MAYQSSSGVDGTECRRFESTVTGQGLVVKDKTVEAPNDRISAPVDGGHYPGCAESKGLRIHRKGARSDHARQSTSPQEHFHLPLETCSQAIFHLRKNHCPPY